MSFNGECGAVLFIPLQVLPTVAAQWTFNVPSARCYYLDIEPAEEETEIRSSQSHEIEQGGSQSLPRFSKEMQSIQRELQELL